MTTLKKTAKMKSVVLICTLNTTKHLVREIAMRKRLRKLMIFIAIMWVIAICVNTYLTISSLMKHKDEPEEEVYDLGEFSIETISDYDIVNVNRFTSFRSHRESSGSSTGAPKGTQYSDADKAIFKCENIFGVMTVSATKAQNCTLVLNITTEINVGTAQIVIVRDDEVIERLDFGGNATRSYNVEGEHIFRVKVLAENAEIKITVEREIFEFEN